MAVGVQIKARHHVGHIMLAMRQPTAGKATEIGVFRTEQLVRLGKVFSLDQPAVLTYQHTKRKPFFRRTQGFRREIGVGRRRAAQIHQRQIEP